MTAYSTAANYHHRTAEQSAARLALVPIKGRDIMTRKEMIDELVECWMTDLSVKDLEEIARDTIEARFQANYDDAQLAAEYAELLGEDA
jgi:hypothetical protein